MGSKFVPLDKRSSCVVVLSDASFAISPSFKSQIEYIILLGDKNGDCHILQYTSEKCRLITRSLMDAEVLALVCTYDEAFYIQYVRCKLNDNRFPTDAYVDSCTTFNYVAKNSGTYKKRVKINVFSLY